MVKPYAVTLPLRRSLTNHSNTYLGKFSINRKVPQAAMDGKALAETSEAASAMGLAAFNLEAVPQETAMDGQEAAALEAFQAAASDLEAVPQAVQEEDQEEFQEAVPLEIPRWRTRKRSRRAWRRTTSPSTTIRRSGQYG